MALLSLEHITIDFPGVRALEDVSFELHAGEVHAVIGENGAGKSTLIKIIAGVWPGGSYQGRIQVDGREVRFQHVRDSERHQIRVIYQELSLVNEMSVAENIFLGHEPRWLGMIDYPVMYAQAREVLQRLGSDLPPERKLSQLTIGQQQIVEIAKAISREARILVLDEPTAALSESDVATLLALIGELRRDGLGIIYISHKLNEVRQIADRVSVLRNGQKVAEFLRDQYRPRDLVRSMTGRALENAFPQVTDSHREPLLSLENVILYHPDNPGQTVLQEIAFTCHQGEVVGIAGLLGSGRTALLSLLFGAYQGRWVGQIRFGGRSYLPRSPYDAIQQGIALVTEDRKRYGLFPTADVAENLGLASLKAYCQKGVLREERLASACQTQVGRLDIKTPSLSFPGVNLSGGNQQKVILGRFLLTHPRLLLLDDPTRGIDVGAKYEIYRLIQELAREGIGILFVSSELPEVIGVSHRILVLREGKVQAEFAHGEAQEADVLALAAGVRDE